MGATRQSHPSPPRPGDNSVEVMMIMVAFKLAFPKAVHLNRGNHEDALANQHYGFADEVKKKCPGTFQDFQDFFENLPLAAVVNNHTFVVHGGLFRFDDVTIADINDVCPAGSALEPYLRLRHDEVDRMTQKAARQWRPGEGWGPPCGPVWGPAMARNPLAPRRTCPVCHGDHCEDYLLGQQQGTPH